MTSGPTASQISDDAFAQRLRAVRWLVLVLVVVGTFAARVHGAGDLDPAVTINHGRKGTPIPIGNDRNEFGRAIAGLGSNQFLVGAPRKERVVPGPDINYTITDGVGEVYVYGIDGSPVRTINHPNPNQYDFFGTAIAAVGNDRFAVGAPGWDIPPRVGARGIIIPGIANVGAVYLFSADGTLIQTVFNPHPQSDDGFGETLAPLGATGFLVGVPLDNAGADNSGRVYVYDVNGTLSGSVTNPTPAANELFGRAVAGVGADRFVVGAPGLFGFDNSAYLYSLNGTLIRELVPEKFQGMNHFGFSAAAIGADSFVVSAPGAKEGRGRAYLFDRDGYLVTGIDNPEPDTVKGFGWSVAAVGPDRFVVGAPALFTDPGRTYLYNIDWDVLLRIHNPDPDKDFFGDQFGSVLAGVGNDRFVVGAPSNDTNEVDAGSVYVYHAPILQYSLGFQIPPPKNFLHVLQLPQTGPGVEPADAGFWYQPLRKLYATKPGKVIIRWQDTNNPPNLVTVQGLNIWPINEANYQIHIAGTPPVDLTGGGTYNSTELLYQDAGMGTVAADLKISHQFVASNPGLSLIRLAATNPNTDLIFFQLLKTVAWDDPKHLHDDNPATPQQDNVPVAIGEVIGNELGFHDPAAGSPFVYWERSRYCPGTNFYDRAQRTGPIIPVNKDLPTVVEDDLVLINYQKATRLKDGASNNVAAPIYWPWKPVRHTADWPSSPEKIVIASTLGSGAIDPAIYTNWDIYVQNDSKAPGFNPNDEHALRRPTAAGEAIFALRDDLGTPETSEPYVLMTYQEDPNDPTFSLADIVRLDSLVAKLIGGSNTVSKFVWSQVSAETAQLFNKFDQQGWDFTIIKQDLVRALNAVIQGNLIYEPQRFSGVQLAAETVALLEQTPPPTGKELTKLNRMLLDDAYPLELVKRQFVENAEKRAKILVFKVVAEEAPYFFKYPATAGVEIQAPFPLSALQKSPKNSAVSGPYWRDRKLSFYAKAAGNDEGKTNIVMRYFYLVQPDFFFPESNPPAPGTDVPWLDLRAGTPKVPHDITYEVQWPPLSPELRVAETLVKEKNKLPNISEQSSVEVIYQQSLALGSGPSVKLIDPTRERQVSLTQLPSDAVTVNLGGKIYFPNLPPHLRNRFTYDPINQKLKFRGELVEVAGEEKYYLLLNVITVREKALLLQQSKDPAFQAAVNSLAGQASSVIDVAPESTAFDSLALTAGLAEGTGYVTLAFGNSTTLTPPAEPVSLEVIKVTCPIYRGELKVIESDNPFDEKLTLRHSGDFAGKTDQYVFEWRTLPPDPNTGLPSAAPPEQWALFNPSPASGQGALDITIEGSGLFTLSDNYFICRYRPGDATNPCGGDWSQWTAPMLAPGWIKRVLSGINPFEQKIKSYQDTAVNTIVSMISQAGTRWAGSVPLSAKHAESFGLIEIYETVLNRGLGLSIEGAPPVDYPPANDALLLAAGRLADLYMLLGNEAFADAADPTIGFGTDDKVYGSEAASIHCFMNQVPSLLEEELALLRGRDDRLLPSIKTYPFYNRLIWNFTGDINGGEVAYALNYDIRDESGKVDGVINEADARKLYPQGHGDAGGHYLTAIKNYYRLLRSPKFTWVPRIEAVLVGGVPVSVDFLDERKFAHTAAARARAGAEIVNLTYRRHYVEDPDGQFQGYKDSDSDRGWGLADWGSRAGQGALFDWVVGNALLLEKDTNPAHTGIQKVDRTTVTELRDIAAAYQEIQAQADTADQGLNPLGLAKNVVPFDIDPSAISQGRTHFEQIYERAVKAMNNAIAVFNHAHNSTQLLRRQADTIADFQKMVQDREVDFNSRLIELFGYPYADDIGPTGTYPSGYDGPDIYHYDYVDASELLGEIPPLTQMIKLNAIEFNVAPNGELSQITKNVTFHIATNGLGLIKPASWTGKRRAPGEIQMARSEFLQMKSRFDKALLEYQNLVAQIEDQAALLEAQHNLNANEIKELNTALATQRSLNESIRSARGSQMDWRQAANSSVLIANASAEALPIVAGLAVDATSVARSGIQLAGAGLAEKFNEFAEEAALSELDHQQAKEIAQAQSNIRLTTLRSEFAIQQQIAQLEQLVRQEATLRLEIFTLRESLQQAAGRYLAALARAQRLLEDRLRFRQQTAAQVHSYRYKDMAFRIFRNDALQKYRAQFDLAARYVYLAARAYDYETNLREGDPRGPGQDFMTQIVRSRSLGLIQNGLPQTGSGQGDAGLADPLARMFSNWDLVLKGQLGFNNPQTETGRFSLRSELFRIQSGVQGQAVWREALTRHVVANLLDVPEFQRFCITFEPHQLVEPAIIIPFSTTINFAQNFFGWPAGGGDNSYDSTHFATKVRSVGIWFANYNNLGGGMVNTPRVYLIPVGSDVMRSPSTPRGVTREWKILDQALPVPFPLSGGALADPSWVPINNTLSDNLAALRRYASFRAYHDSGSFDPAQTISDTRLIGRSVWNTRWLLIIPAGTLHSDRNEGIQRFIHGALLSDGQRGGNGVTDIKIFFQTYAYAGN